MGQLFLLTLSPGLLKKSLKTQENLKELEIIYIKMQSISVFLDITNLADFQRKKSDVSRTQGLSHVNPIFFGSSLGKV